MAKLRISFNPIFVMFAFIVIYFGWTENFLVYLIVLFLHEFAHFAVSKMYGYKLNKIAFMPYGAELGGESNIFLPKHEIVIALAGPLLNLFLALCCLALWWAMPIAYSYTTFFMEVNLVLALFNFLPIFPVDGGRIVVAMFTNKSSKIKLYNIMKVVGICVSIVFAVMFVVSIFYTINLNLFFISMFLLLSSFNSSKDVYYEKSNVKKIKHDSSLGLVEVKTFMVNKKMPVHKLLKHIKGKHYTNFIVVDDNLNVIKTISENEVVKLLVNSKIK